MRRDATFIGIEVDEGAIEGEVAAKLAEICPVDIYAAADGAVQIVEANIDECILCGMCEHAAPTGAVQVHRLYERAVAS